MRLHSFPTRRSSDLDDDVEAKTENVKYGPEPLSAFFDRYVIAHKAGHLDQLRALATAAGSGPPPARPPA